MELFFSYAQDDTDRDPAFDDGKGRVETLPRATAKVRKLFDEMFDTARLHTMSMMSSMPSHPVRIQPIFMSIVFEHYKQLQMMDRL